MATRRQQMRELRRLTRVAMLAFINDVRSKKIVIAEVEAAIHDAEKLYDLLELRGGDLVATTDAIREAISTGGTLQQTRGLYNVNTVSATEFMLTQSAKLVTDIHEQQRKAIRAITSAGRSLGESPRTIALDLVGRIGANGKREGGVVGLNGPQGEAVANAARSLRSGNPAQMREYLKNVRRDRRYDAIVERYAALGKPIPKDVVHKIVTRYQARLLVTRGETIARTEMLEGINGGGYNSVLNQIESGLIPPMDKVWLSKNDDRTRHDHWEMQGVRVPIDEPFVLPDGSELMFPTDSSLGAAAGEVINCRCTLQYVRSDS